MYGAGSTVIRIEGVSKLGGTEHSIIADRIESGTYAVMAAITGGDVTVRGAVSDFLKPVTMKLRESGVEVTERKDSLRIRTTGPLKNTDIVTMPHPGFPTDMQQPFVALLTLAKGTSVVRENVYERRFAYVGELLRMGADIKQDDRTAIITGVKCLTGAEVTATDLRAGAALIAAALAAEGVSEISGTSHINRGYENIDTKLSELGALITRNEPSVMLSMAQAV